MFKYLAKINKIETSFNKGCFLLDIDESEGTFKTKTKGYNKKGSYEKFKTFAKSFKSVVNVESKVNEITEQREKVIKTRPRSSNVSDTTEPKAKKVRRRSKQKES